MEQIFETSLVELDKIKPSFFQTRTETIDENIQDLVASIKKYGVLQPILLRHLKDDYEVCGGDRRFRAAKLAGLKAIPATIRDLSDEDALVLQATENLQRQGLSDNEKKRIIGELVTRCKFNGKEIAERLGMSYSWVSMYMPDELKDPDRVADGYKGSEKRYGTTSLGVPCEYCTVSTSEPKEWENHKLCPLHYSQALEDPARFKRFFGSTQQHPVIGEHIQSQPLDSWEVRKAQMSPEHSEMEQTIMQLLLDKGVKPILTNQKYCLLSTTPDFVFPALNLAVYLDGTAVHSGKQSDRDDELRGLLQKRHGMRILSIPYSSKSKAETDRILNEILKEVKKE